MRKMHIVFAVFAIILIWVLVAQYTKSSKKDILTQKEIDLMYLDETENTQTSQSNESVAIVDGFQLRADDYSYITLYDFWEWMQITAPTQIRGNAPRNWFAEGIIWVQLIDTEWNILLNTVASWPWLEMVEWTTEMRASDRIEFSVDIWTTAQRNYRGTATLLFEQQNSSWEWESQSVSVDVNLAL